MPYLNPKQFEQLVRSVRWPLMPLGDLHECPGRHLWVEVNGVGGEILGADDLDVIGNLRHP